MIGDALQEREAATLHVGETPEDRAALDEEVRLEAETYPPEEPTPEPPQKAPVKPRCKCMVRKLPPAERSEIDEALRHNYAVRRIERSLLGQGYEKVPTQATIHKHAKHCLGVMLSMKKTGAASRSSSLGSKATPDVAVPLDPAKYPSWEDLEGAARYALLKKIGSLSAEKLVDLVTASAKSRGVEKPDGKKRPTTMDRLRDDVREAMSRGRGRGKLRAIR